MENYNMKINEEFVFDISAGTLPCCNAVIIAINLWVRAQWLGVLRSLFFWGFEHVVLLLMLRPFIDRYL
jgi:hypothetical protein